MTIKMLQNARNWAEKHQKFASGWGSDPDPSGDGSPPDPLNFLKSPPSQIPGYATDKDWTVKDEDEDKDKDLTLKDKDKDKDLTLKARIRTRTRTYLV